MQIDYDAVAGALKEIDYKGYFTLEADVYLNQYTPDNIMEGIKALAVSAKKLADIFEM